jgi:hypothetical protein
MKKTPPKRLAVSQQTLRVLSGTKLAPVAAGAIVISVYKDGQYGWCLSGAGECVVAFHPW